MAATGDKGPSEREVRERYEAAIERIREGSYRFSSKLRGQAGIILEELVDPDGDAVQSLADIEGDVGALALAVPIDMITCETWLLGQIGDREQLDLDVGSHEELWFNFGAWIGEMLRLRHGGHWLIRGDSPGDWRLGFSKIMLEVIPWSFAEQLLRSGSGCVKRMLAEVERLRLRHQEQKEKNGGNEIDRFTADHYVRLHTIPLGQWMVMDLRLIHRLWSQATAKDLIKEVKKAGKRLGEDNAPVVAQVVEALTKADGQKPIASQTSDRGLFEAVAQMVALRRTAPPIAVDILEKLVLPSMHIGVPERFPPLDDEEFAALRKGAEMFAVFVDVIPHKYRADDEGLLGSIGQDELSSPYGSEGGLDVGKGDWVVVNPSRFKTMLLDFDSKRLLAKYDDFVKYLRSNPKAPRRRDDGRYLAEMAVRALADLKACVVFAGKENYELLFRLLPPPD